MNNLTSEQIFNELEFDKKFKKIEKNKSWFNTYYMQHEQKYRRLISLKLTCDDGTDPVEKLKSLYLEAEEKRKEVQKLEKEINRNGTLHDNII